MGYCDSQEHARQLSIAHVRLRLLAEGSCFVTRGSICRILTVANGAHNHRVPDLVHWHQGAETWSRIQDLENWRSINTASIVLQLRWLEMSRRMTQYLIKKSGWLIVRILMLLIFKLIFVSFSNMSWLSNSRGIGNNW